MKTNKELDALDMMDWKEIEAGAENAIKQSRKDTAIAMILLGNARSRITKLGGKTLAQIELEAKIDADRQKAQSTNTQ